MTPFMERRLLRELQAAMEQVKGRDVDWDDVLDAAQIAFQAAQRAIAASRNQLVHSREFPTLRAQAIANMITYLQTLPRSNPEPWTGTPRQIAWAEAIREEAKPIVEDWIADELSHVSRMRQHGKTPARIEAVRAKALWMQRALRSCDSRFWIDARACTDRGAFVDLAMQRLSP